MCTIIKYRFKIRVCCGFLFNYFAFLFTSSSPLSNRYSILRLKTIKCQSSQDQDTMVIHSTYFFFCFYVYNLKRKYCLVIFIIRECKYLSLLFNINNSKTRTNFDILCKLYLVHVCVSVCVHISTKLIQLFNSLKLKAFKSKYN